MNFQGTVSLCFFLHNKAFFPPTNKWTYKVARTICWTGISAIDITRLSFRQYIYLSISTYSDRSCGIPVSYFITTNATASFSNAVPINLIYGRELHQLILVTERIVKHKKVHYYLLSCNSILKSYMALFQRIPYTTNIVPTDLVNINSFIAC